MRARFVFKNSRRVKLIIKKEESERRGATAGGESKTDVVIQVDGDKERAEYFLRVIFRAIRALYPSATRLNKIKTNERGDLATVLYFIALFLSLSLRLIFERASVIRRKICP